MRRRRGGASGVREHLIAEARAHIRRHPGWPRVLLDALEAGDGVVVQGYQLPDDVGFDQYDDVLVKSDGTCTRVRSVDWLPLGPGTAPYRLGVVPVGPDGDVSMLVLNEAEARRRYPEKVVEHLAWIAETRGPRLAEIIEHSGR